MSWNTVLTCGVLSPIFRNTPYDRCFIYHRGLANLIQGTSYGGCFMPFLQSEMKLWIIEINGKPQKTIYQDIKSFRSKALVYRRRWNMRIIFQGN